VAVRRRCRGDHSRARVPRSAPPGPAHRRHRRDHRDPDPELAQGKPRHACHPDRDRVHHSRPADGLPRYPSPPPRGRRIVARPAWLVDAERLDRAIYAAIAATDTPSLDRAMTRLTRAADHSKLSVAAAAVLSMTRGRKGRRAAFEG